MGDIFQPSLFKKNGVEDRLLFNSFVVVIWGGDGEEEIMKEVGRCSPNGGKKQDWEFKGSDDNSALNTGTLFAAFKTPYIRTFFDPCPCCFFLRIPNSRWILLPCEEDEDEDDGVIIIFFLLAEDDGATGVSGFKNTDDVGDGCAVVTGSKVVTPRGDIDEIHLCCCISLLFFIFSSY